MLLFSRPLEPSFGRVLISTILMNKEQLVKELVSRTGFSERRARNYFERFNWDKEKVYNYSIVKSSLRQEVSLFDEVSTPVEKPSQKVRKPRKKKVDKTKSSDEKTSQTSKSKKDTNIITKTTEDGCIEYDVEIINGAECFRGKPIQMDSNGFYHPHASMKEINEWVHKFLKKK